MGSDMMDVDQLAAYLRRDAREVGKLASRGRLPGHKVGGVWRFARAEINHWLESQIHGYSDEELTALESGTDRDGDAPLIANLLSPACVAVPLAASTKASVLKELVKLAEESWELYDPEAILDAVRAREEIVSTALPTGVAYPHPRRPLPTALGESVLAFGRTGSGFSLKPVSPTVPASGCPGSEVTWLRTTAYLWDRAASFGSSSLTSRPGVRVAMGVNGPRYSIGASGFGSNVSI